MAKRNSFKKLQRFLKNWWPRLIRTVIALVCAALLLPPVLVAITAVSKDTIMTLQRVARGAEVQQHWRPLESISPHLRHAVLAAEDSKFCQHNGFDWDAISAAWQFNQQGQGKRGASTISMQTAKNVFLWPQRSWVRKGFEAYFTVFVELMWSKPQILETYLNVVEWGTDVYGAEAAARYHFGKSASYLSRSEAARLAAILPSPVKCKANPPGRYVLQRSSVLVRRMAVVADGHARCLD